MRNRLAKLTLMLLVVSLNYIGITNAFYTSSATSTTNTYASTCWIAPSVPVQTYPSDGHHAGLGSTWDLNPYLDWDDSTTSCPTGVITYQYEAYSDSGLTSLVYQSGWLSTSQIAAPGTPEGFYYWRVRAKDQFNNISAFSSARLLVVDRTAPPVPLLVSPGNNTKMNSNNLYQTWQQVVDNLGENVLYDYEAYSDSGLTTLVDSGSFNNSSDGNGSLITKNSVGLANGHYYWRVRSEDQSGNQSNWSTVWHFEVDNSLPDPVLVGPGSSTSTVVLNEILPDPAGADNATKPNGEWVELYNTSGSSVDTNGWHITDADGNSVVINSTRTNTGGTVIAGNGFLVVFTGTSALTLNNSGDTVNLYNGNVLPVNLIDTHAYGSTPEGKSIARLPDGTGPWYDPIPTPGEPNIVTEEEKNGSPVILDLEGPSDTSSSAELKTEENTDTDKKEEKKDTEVSPTPEPSIKDEEESNEESTEDVPSDSGEEEV